MKVRERLTFANVVACIALFVSLGGVGYAAISLPKNSVGPKQLKRGAVTLAKLSVATKRALGITHSIGVAGPRGADGAQGPQGPQGPGAISFEEPVSSVSGPIKTFNGVSIYGRCSATETTIGLLPSPAPAATLTAIGFATINATLFPIKETNSGGGTYGSGTNLVVIDAIARNAPNGPAFTHFKFALKAPDCVVRGTITPSSAS